MHGLLRDKPAPARPALCNVICLDRGGYQVLVRVWADGERDALKRAGLVPGIVRALWVEGMYRCGQ